MMETQSSAGFGEQYQAVSYGHVNFDLPIRHVNGSNDWAVSLRVWGSEKRSKLVYICENHQHTDKMVLKVRGTDLMTNNKRVNIKEVQN